MFRRYVLALLSVGLLRKFEAYLVYLSIIWNKNPRPFTFFSKIPPFCLFVAMVSPCHPQFSRANWWHAQSFFSSVQATTTHDIGKRFIDIFRTFYQRKVRLSFLDWEPKCGDSIHHTVLSRETGLESPKSLASDRASFLDSFSPIGQVAFTSITFALISASILVFFSILKVTVLVCWMKTSPSPVKWRGEENWKLLLSRSLLH